MVNKPITIPYPAWICHDCGIKYGNRIPSMATYHDDTCGIWQQYKVMTEPRDYGHLINSPGDHMEVDPADIYLNDIPEDRQPGIDEVFASEPD